MSPITGKLIFAGHLDVNADQIIGVALECEQDNLRNCNLPMYQECVVIMMTEYLQIITSHYGGSDDLTCSPSLTPETDEWIATQPPTLLLARRQMEKLERERNDARKALEAIEEIYIDGCDTYGDHEAMGDIARKFLSENAQAMASADEKLPPKGSDVYQPTD